MTDLETRNARLKAATDRDMARLRELEHDESLGLWDKILAAYIIGGHIPLENEDRQSFLDATAQQVLPEALRLARSPGVDHLGLSVEAFAATLAYDAATALLSERNRRRG